MLAAVHSDYRLKDAYRELKEGYLSLPKIVLSPGRQAVDNILRYSKSSMVEA
ncbi:MAG: hypothetical protein R3275_13040 [Saprospiraceae bacterium]|nr:hypothetical protein [Saprospiraceae bacterium]